MKEAPFTHNQVLSINGYQRSGVFHEFTCPNEHDGRRELYATCKGLFCPNCSWTQSWVHDFMADFSWQQNPAWRRRSDRVKTGQPTWVS